MAEPVLPEVRVLTPALTAIAAGHHKDFGIAVVAVLVAPHLDQSMKAGC
jgi:hypothetical protein